MTIETTIISDPNFSVVAVELQRLVRDGWYISDTPYSNFIMFEIPMQRNQESIRQLATKAQAVAEERPPMTVTDKLAKARLAKTARNSKRDDE